MIARARKHGGIVGRKLINKLPFYYGWIIVFLAGMALFFTGPGQTFSFSMFIDEFINEYGWSRTAVSNMYTIATIISGSTMFFVGKFIDKIGVKKVAIGATIILGIGCIYNSFIVSLPMLFVGFFIGRFSGQGTLELAGTSIVPHWFVKKRGLTMMLAALGGTVASAVYPLLNDYLITSFGWQIAYRTIGIMGIVLFVPLAWLLLYDKPEDIGLYPDNVKEDDEDSYSFAEVMADDKNSFELDQVVKTPAFWILLFIMAQSSFVGTGVTFNFVSILNENGYDRLFAARILGISPVFGFGATFFIGTIVDKLKKPNILLGFALIANGLAYLLLLSASNLAPYIYAVTLGLSGAMARFTAGYLRPAYFGRKHIASILGLFAIVNVIASGLGVLPFGIVYDTFGTYKGILIVVGCLPIIVGFLSFSLRKPDKSEYI
jgi:sugar phosphate permease